MPHLSQLECSGINMTLVFSGFIADFDPDPETCLKTKLYFGVE